ncbi:GILT-like protein 1 [Diorhabda sublineata]|uniref:GILT-like protein 1 n=1 Tax=Diorhabda sublineata TaxID=1163346 RepID=UPI0024E0B6D1|nr:GILT-like protein 1 [Diorhabda sublineata]
MKSEMWLLFVFIVTVSAHSQHDHHDNHQDHLVNVSVYYESLCPDSRKFFTQQLYPSLRNLSSYVNLTLVPYGKSTSTFDITDWQFQCHHGEIECYGNKIQACALKLIDKGENSQNLAFNEVAVGYINCLMDRADKTAQVVFPTKDCALVNPVSNVQDIENCANHTDASNYLSIMGKLTDAVQKPLKSVPTIVFNDEFKQEDNELAQTNFVQALCQYIKGEKPAECSKANAITFSITLVIISILFNFN